jgi:hypothetical protein
VVNSSSGLGECLAQDAPLVLGEIRELLPAVYNAHYAKPFRDDEERAKLRESLASIGFGHARVDQELTNEGPNTSSSPL